MASRSWLLRLALLIPPVALLATLLAVLARHAGQVLSKARLLELVWGYDSIDENLVEVHVSILRRELGQPAAALIQTVRGVGYVLREDEQRTRG